jgi:hypothetical protein
MRDLDGEEVKTRVRRQAFDENLQVFEVAERMIDDCRRQIMEWPAPPSSIVEFPNQEERSDGENSCSWNRSW